MKTVENLINSERNKTLGNHHAEIISDEIRHFYYYNTVICKANDKTMEFKVDNGGYNTSSTTRAINSYRKNLLALGYTEI